MTPIRNIVFLTPGFPINEDDYLCIPPLQALAHNLNQEQLINLSVISLQYPYKQQNYTWKNIPIYACGGDNKSFPLRLITWRKAIKTFKKLNSQHKVDIIHSFWLNEAAFIGQYLAKKYQCKHICTLMGQDVLSSNRYLKKIDLTKMTTVSLSTNQEKEYINTTQQQPSTTIPWGIDKTAFPPLQTSKDIDILGVGSLTTLKNFDLFVDVIAAIKATIPNIKACIIGDGPEKDNLNQKINRLHLQDNIQLLGQLHRREVLENMSNAKLLLHTSDYESFGYVFQEALQAGMRIVSKNVGCASPSTFWKIGTNVEDMASLVKEGITTATATSTTPNEHVNAIEDTVNSYLELYK